MVVISLLVLVVVYALSDRMAPSSSRGIVSAHVVQISARAPGEVTNVTVADDAVVEAGDVLFELAPPLRACACPDRGKPLGHQSGAQRARRAGGQW